MPKEPMLEGDIFRDDDSDLSASAHQRVDEAAQRSVQHHLAATNRRRFACLVGQWHIDRRMLQFVDGGAEPDAAAASPIAIISGRLRGRACFERIDASTLSYREEGILRLRQGGTTTSSGVVSAPADAEKGALKAVRRYIYRLDDTALLIDFDDGPNAGQRFLTLELAAAEDESSAAAVRRQLAARTPLGRAIAGDRAHLVGHHLCGKDLYQALYRFDGFDGEDADGPINQRRQRIVQWTRVSGPRKDYAIVTVLTAMSSGGDA